jgi:hypothetical protein
MGTRFFLVSLIAAASIGLEVPAFGKERSAADKALFQKALKECNSPKYTNGARIQMNYAKGTYRCIRIESNNRR